MVIAENCTSALDAIQVLFGATLGNQLLKVIDFGKHNYTFSLKKGGNGFRLSLKELRYDHEDEYLALEEKIMKNQVLLDEVVQLQELIDDRVKQLFAFSPEELFSAEQVTEIQATNEMPTIYLSCWGCEQQVLRSRAIDFRGKVYCIPCFQRMNTGCIHHNLQ